MSLNDTQRTYFKLTKLRTKTYSQPTSNPSNQPSFQPTSRPSNCPSRQPSNHPSIQPSIQPSGSPTTVSSVLCPLGEYSLSGYKPCTSCAIGSYSVKSGSNSCYNCPSNSISQGGTDYCICAIGNYTYHTCSKQDLTCSNTCSNDCKMASCPTGYTYANTIPSCYKVVSTNATWSVAVANCSADNNG